MSKLTIFEITMEKTLLLEKQKRWQWIAMAALFTINGIILMLGDDLVNVRWAIGLAMIFLSLLYIIYFFLGYSVKSQYAAKLRITDQLIEIKASFWKPIITLRWSDIKKVHFGHFQVDFELSDSIKTVSYDTNTEKSIELKKLLRESAEKNNIIVSGG